MEEAVDAIQHRYGWTDAEVGQLPYARFRRLRRLIERRAREESRERLQSGAWIAFQMGAGGEATFGDYLDKIGLGGQKAEPKLVTAADAIAKAEAILEKARERI